MVRHLGFALTIALVTGCATEPTRAPRRPSSPAEKPPTGEQDAEDAEESPPPRRSSKRKQPKRDEEPVDAQAPRGRTAPNVPSPQERADKYTWPTGVAGLRLGWTKAQLDQACRGAPTAANGVTICLHPPKVGTMDVVIAADFCEGNNACEYTAIHARPQGTLDWQWLNTFDKVKGQLTELYGPGMLEHEGPASCDDDMLACIRAGKLRHRISWIFVKDGEIGHVLLVLGTTGKTESGDAFLFFYRNTEWWKRELALQKAQKDAL